MDKYINTKNIKYQSLPLSVLSDVFVYKSQIDEMPADYPSEEVEEGEWIDKENPQWRAYEIRYCSKCGWNIHKTKLRQADLNWNFCPNCGIKMKRDMIGSK